MREGKLDREIFENATPISLYNYVSNFVDKYYEGEYTEEDLNKLIIDSYNSETDEGYFVSYLLSFESDMKLIRGVIVNKIWRLKRGDLRILMQAMEQIRNKDYLSLFHKLGTLRLLYFSSNKDNYEGLMYAKACCYLRENTALICDERWEECILTDLRQVQANAEGTCLESCFENLLGLRESVKDAILA